MKHIFSIVLLILIMVSCKKEQPPKDYAVIHGTITNPIDSLNLRLYDPKSNKSFIVEVDKDGNFRDTLKLEEPVTFTTVYENIFALYLKNDMEIKIDFDIKKFSETLGFTGNGEAQNNILKYKAEQANELYGEDYKVFLSLDRPAFEAKTNAYVNGIEKQLEINKAKLDSAFINLQKQELKSFQEQNLAQYEEQQKINKLLGKGKPSPEFKDYINYVGGTSSLKDFKGSYVYIDVWATWCVPCIYEIPYLEKLEKDYHGKNIKFVSLSIDNAKDEAKWRKMIKDKNMSGVQILADNAYDSQFIKDYFIYGIPRFILLDPKGNIVNYDAPRPSEEKLKTLFNSLDI
ncbi:MAG: TlpA disulfide reductase family protein [Flavobacteriaceae bacterium]|nr:TlpA family protein disulfide reductase [Flavobacteriaceae bacterium]